ncbi:MAG: orotate phosphoribosyltransferase [Opitutaceae bacterium]|nr:orotate phosphoribosyltransferase [Opitutaceae bacterium]
MTREELGKAIYESCNIKGEFLLRSGKTATEYFDKYLFEANPIILAAVAEHITPRLPSKVDRLAGLEMGGIPIATAISLQTRIPTLFIRKAAKPYGTCKIAEGGDFEGTELVIIEDVVTSGGAVIEAVSVLREQGAIVNHVICVIDREDSGGKNLENIGLIFSPLFTKSELEKHAGVL